MRYVYGSWRRYRVVPYPHPIRSRAEEGKEEEEEEEQEQEEEGAQSCPCGKCARVKLMVDGICLYKE